MEKPGFEKIGKSIVSWDIDGNFYVDGQKTAKGTAIENFALQNGWEFGGLTNDMHWKWFWTDPQGVDHLVISGNPKKTERQSRILRNELQNFNKCMRGACQHSLQQQAKIGAIPEEFDYQKLQQFAIGMFKDLLHKGVYYIKAEDEVRKYLMDTFGLDFQTVHQLTWPYFRKWDDFNMNLGDSAKKNYDDSDWYADIDIIENPILDTKLRNQKPNYGKTADYFYDWQGYYPDDGSLEDGIVNPAAPAPSFINRPNRCTCNPGHLVNTEQYNKEHPSICPDCGKPQFMEEGNGIPNALEYDDMLQHSPWWRSGSNKEIWIWVYTNGPEYDDFIDEIFHPYTSDGSGMGPEGRDLSYIIPESEWPSIYEALSQQPYVINIEAKPVPGEEPNIPDSPDDIKWSKISSGYEDGIIRTIYSDPALFRYVTTHFQDLFFGNQQYSLNWDHLINSVMESYLDYHPEAAGLPINWGEVTKAISDIAYDYYNYMDNSSSGVYPPQYMSAYRLANGWPWIMNEVYDWLTNDETMYNACMAATKKAYDNDDWPGLGGSQLAKELEAIFREWNTQDSLDEIYGPGEFDMNGYEFNSMWNAIAQQFLEDYKEQQNHMDSPPTHPDNADYPPKDWGKDSAYIDDFSSDWQEWARDCAEAIIDYEGRVKDPTYNRNKFISWYARRVGIKVGWIPEFASLVRTFLSDKMDSIPTDFTLADMGIPPEGEEYYRTADVTDPFLRSMQEGQQERRELEEAQRERAQFRMPEKALQEALYFHQCPMCRGYLRQQGEHYWCESCPFSYEPKYSGAYPPGYWSPGNYQRFYDEFNSESDEYLIEEYLHLQNGQYGAAWPQSNYRRALERVMKERGLDINPNRVFPGHGRPIVGAWEEDDGNFIPGQTKIPFGWKDYSYSRGRSNGITWESINSKLGDKSSKKVQNNTWLERLGDGGVGLRFHSTYVIKYYPDHFELNTGGWNTMTTRRRINDWIPVGYVFNHPKEQELMYAPGDAYPREPDPYRNLEVERKIDYPTHPGWRDQTQMTPEEIEQYKQERQEYSEQMRLYQDEIKRNPDVVNKQPYENVPEAYFWTSWTGYQPGKLRGYPKVDYAGDPIFDEEYKPKYKYTAWDNSPEEDPNQKKIDLYRTPTVEDEKGNPIEIGTRVYYFDDPSSIGTVERISDFDADVNDYGRGYQIYPRVYVLWDGIEGTEGLDTYDTYLKHPPRSFYDEPPVICEELMSIKSKISAWDEELNPDQMSIPTNPIYDEIKDKWEFHLNVGDEVYYSDQDNANYGEQGIVTAVSPTLGYYVKWDNGNSGWFTDQQIWPLESQNWRNYQSPGASDYWYPKRSPRYSETLEPNEPWNHINDAKQLILDMLQMGWSDKENLITDAAIELAARGLEPDDAYNLAEDVVNDLGLAVSDAAPGFDWPDLSPNRDYPGNLDWKNINMPINLPRNQGKVAKKTYYHGTNAKLNPGDIIVPGDEFGQTNWPGMDIGHSVWMHDNPDLAGSYGSHVYEVEPLDYVENFSEQAGHTEGEGALPSWAHEFITPRARVIREYNWENPTHIAMGFDNPSADRYRIDTPVYFRDKMIPETLQDMDFLDSGPASYINIERFKPLNNNIEIPDDDISELIPYHGKPIRTPNS